MLRWDGVSVGKRRVAGEVESGERNAETGERKPEGGGRIQEAGDRGQEVGGRTVGLTMLDELLDGYPNVFGDLTQQEGGKIAALVVGHSSLAAISVLELAV